MKIIGNLRKLETELVGTEAQYALKIKDILEPLPMLPLNELIGETISISFEGYYNSVISGTKMKKPFGEGLTYQEFMDSPQASPSIMRPELSQIHLGIALRDYDWEVEHHLQPHFVYIALTSDYKVGVTRATNVPYRWLDQGATEAILLAQVPYRQLAGLIEVSLKPHISDKTAWQQMLKGSAQPEENILAVKDRIAALIPAELQAYILPNNKITQISYPVLSYPSKVNSIKLDTVKSFSQKLLGIKGQYLLFEDGVLNVRSHAGCRVTVEVG